MDSIQFVQRYQDYIDELSLVIKPELQPALNKLREIDPHDLIRPEGYFEK